MLALAFMLPGLFGHDPWKTEDAVGFGVVYSLLDQGAWLTPQLAGEPYLEDGPLYYWLAAGLASLAAFALPLHDGARLASLATISAAFYFTRLAARELYGKRSGDLSALAFLGCVGLLVHAHEVLAETAMLAFLALAYYGVSIAWKKPLKAGVCFGIGAGGAFLAKGLAAWIAPVIAVLLLLPIAIHENARNYVKSVGLGLVLMALIMAPWPMALAHTAPDYLRLWWDWQVGRLGGAPRVSTSLEYLKTLAWTAWPAWPMTLWAAWAFRSTLRNPGFAVPLVAALVVFALLLLDRAPRELDALALLVPLSIPAGAVAMGLRRGAANALSWFSLMTFGLISATLWVMWFAMQTGFPARLAANVAKLEPGFEPTLSWFAVAIAAVYTLGWIVLVARSEDSTLRSVPFWTSGLTLTWGLAMTLWIGWIDYGKTYRYVAEGIAAQAHVMAGCVASRGLGEVQRAAFHYHGGLLTERTETGAGATCKLLLVQTDVNASDALPEAEWYRIWEGARPRDRERYMLFHRID